jgi:hypothetical protein
MGDKQKSIFSSFVFTYGPLPLAFCLFLFVYLEGKAARSRGYVDGGANRNTNAQDDQESDEPLIFIPFPPAVFFLRSA